MDAQSDQDLNCQLTESLDTIECINGEQRPSSYFVHVQDDLNLHILHIFKGTFSLEKAYMFHLIYLLSFSNLGPIVQSVISLTSSLRVISLTVLVDSIYNILIFFAEKM